MFFYCIENECIIKYKINLDESKLKELRREIIENCSTIIHKVYETCALPKDRYNYEKIRNYREKKIGVHEYRDFLPDEDIYLVEYFYYEHPRLVTLIEELLKGNTSVIRELKNPKIENINEEEIILNEQKEIIEILNNNKSNDITKQLNLLKENQKKLEDYKKKKELNQNQISEVLYYDRVFNCIKLEELSRIKLKHVLDIQEFLLDSNIETLDLECNKILQLTIKK